MRENRFSIINPMEREAFVEVGGRRQRYLEAGSGWPLILLHAFPLNADLWRPQLERVPRGWRFLAPDLRGFGPGVWPAAAASMDDIAADVAAFMDALEIDNAVIGGLSMGGYVTMALYRAAPERFTAMVLANTKAGPDNEEGRAARDKMAALVRRDGPPAVADQMIPKLLGTTSHHARPYLAPLVRRLIETNTTEGIAGAIHALKERPDSMPTLERSAVPALVITGEEDAIIPVSESEAMARAISRVQLVVLHAAGHLSSLEVPGDFSEALGNFLRANL
jgi:pimeloyl-ACP methyl ester carboxylesterase